MRGNVALLGLGAIGSVIFSQLRNNEKLDIHCYNRSVKDTIRIDFNNERLSYFIDCQTNLNENVRFDWLIICMKEYHYSAAKDLLDSLISIDTKIAVIRNGLHLKDVILSFAPAENILECMIDCPVQKLSSAHYLQLRKPIISTEKNKLSRTFQNLFPVSNITFNQVEDFHTVAWKKLCESSSIGAITALSGRTVEIFSSLEIRKLYAQFLLESIQVAKADEADIENEFYEKILAKLPKYPAEKGSSMLTDRLAGNPIELGAKSQIIVDIGLKYGIATPLHTKTCSILEKPDLDTDYLKEFILL